MDIVLFSFDKLRGRVGRAHHFARELARRHRVVFVDPPESLLRSGRLRTTAETVADGLVHVRLSGGLPGRRWRPVHVLNELRWLKAIGRVLQQRNWGARGTRVCLHMLPVWEMAAEALRPDVTVYDAHDDWRSMPPNPAGLTECLEREHARSADIILSASAATKRNFAELGRTTHPLPNACEAEYFARAMTETEADELAGIPRPRIMFIGGVEESFDTDTVLHVARAMPDVSFVVVGPEIRRQRALRRQANVHMLGERPYDQLPRYLAGAEACWIPYRTTQRVTGRDCIKLYEYLASGRRVVSVPLGRAVELGEHVHVSDGTADGMAAACRAALADDSATRREARVAAAREHTWASRAAELERLIDEFARAGGERDEGGDDGGRDEE